MIPDFCDNTGFIPTIWMRSCLILHGYTVTYNQFLEVVLCVHCSVRLQEDVVWLVLVHDLLPGVAIQDGSAKHPKTMVDGPAVFDRKACELVILQAAVVGYFCTEIGLGLLYQCLDHLLDQCYH